jgi:hypothetical protein
MAENEVDRDIEAVVTQIEKDLEGTSHPDKLRAIRDLLDDAAFLPQLRDLLARRHNDPQSYEIPNAISRILRKVEELRDERETDRGLVAQLAIGGGATLLIGSVIASLNPVIGVFALIPAVGGVVMSGAAWIGLRRVDKEKTLYRQIGDRLGEIRRGIS